ncbi:hypothetical protein [Actinosynnema sp. NPDC020468]|uniref:hypothetical protein n=1 Tax=Actinosynnema sp. NPDC020468 TaxID=3154488 RepID=UPI0033D6D71F
MSAELERLLVELGRSMDRPPPEMAVENIMLALRPRRRRWPCRGWPLAAAGVVLAAAVVLGSLYGTPSADSTGGGTLPVSQASAEPCAGWTGFVEVGHDVVAARYGWEPPSLMPWPAPLRIRESGIGPARGVVLVDYEVAGVPVLLERYTAGAETTPAPAPLGPQSLLRREFAAQYRITAEDGGRAGTGLVKCRGTRAVWRIGDAVYAVTGDLPDWTVLELAGAVR